MINLADVSKIFYQGKDPTYALKNVNLSVKAGQIFGVIGLSGAGKSTLIRTINLLEKPTSGKVYIDNVDITHLPHRTLTATRHNIGMIFQHFNLLSSRTVFKNIALPLELQHKSKEWIKTRVSALLELVELSDKADRYPKHLSGGQQQRVAIARALASQPKILLCDEATSALDPTTTHTILNLLKTINKKLNLTILLITHEMDVIKQICDNVAIIHHGKLIEQSSVGELFSNPKTAIAKALIHSVSHINVPDDYLKKLQPTYQKGLYPLLKMKFNSVSVDMPLLSQITKQFTVENNIISAQMDYAGGVKFGTMLAKMIGEPQQIQDAIAYLITHNTKVEVLGYV